MMIIEGLVLKERPVGEQDKFVDILTKEKGIIELSVKGGLNINGKSGSSTQLLHIHVFAMTNVAKNFS